MKFTNRIIQQNWICWTVAIY